MPSLIEASYDQEDMIEPIERLFEREYPTPRHMFADLDEISDGHDFADLAYVQGGPKHLHVIKLEESYADCVSDVRAGVHALGHVDANFRWLGVPLDSFRHGEREVDDLLVSICAERGIGILLVQPKGVGLSVKVELHPKRADGNFMSEFPRVRAHWRREVRGD